MVINIPKEQSEKVIPAMARIMKVARMKNPVIELPLGLYEHIELDEMCSVSYYETDESRIVKLIFKKKDEGEVNE